MSFFNKMLASIGIGSATVDTKLEKSRYTAGEIIRGNVEVTGGNTDQDVDRIYLTLYTTLVKPLIHIDYAYFYASVDFSAYYVKIYPLSAISNNILLFLL